MAASTVMRLLLLALLWGSNFLLIAVALDGFTPGQILVGRMVLGAAALAGLVAVGGQRLPRDVRTWQHLSTAALVGNVVPYYLFAWSEQTIASSVAGTLNATTPLWTLLIALLLGQERARLDRSAGLLLGFVGVVIVLSPWQVGASAGVPGQLAALAASASYGVTFVYQRRYLTGRGVPPLVLAAGQTTAASVLLVPVMPFVVTSAAPAPRPVLALVALGVLGTGLAYAVNFRLVADVGATRASTVTYLLPVVAVGLGAAVLGEPITAGVVAGAAVVLAGVALAQGRLTRARQADVRTGAAAVTTAPAARRRHR